MYNSNKAGLILVTPGFRSPAFGPVGCPALSSQWWCWSREKGIRGWHLHELRGVFPLPSMDHFGSDQCCPGFGGQSARGQEQRHTSQSSSGWVYRSFVCQWQDSSFPINVAALRSSNCRWISRDRQCLMYHTSLTIQAVISFWRNYFSELSGLCSYLKVYSNSLLKRVVLKALKSHFGCSTKL